MPSSKPGKPNKPPGMRRQSSSARGFAEAKRAQDEELAQKQATDAATLLLMSADADETAQAEATERKRLAAEDRE